MPPELSVTAADVASARSRTDGIVVRTPLVPSLELGERVGAEVTLKLEGVQPTGSFKVRGAASRILSSARAPTGSGVVTASTGNHGRAVAYVARRAGVPAAVCVSRHVPAGKLAALEALGCELVIGGESQTEALTTAQKLARTRGWMVVHPFDDVEVIAGQGGIGLELLEDEPDLNTVLVPMSGGGLVAGIAVAVKAVRPEVRVVGVSMRRAAVMTASLTAGRPVELPEEPTLADSLQGGIGVDNRHTFALVRALVDETVLIDESDIWEGMRFAFTRHRLVLEGAGAVGIGALLSGSVRPGGPVAVVCSGANAEPSHVQALARGDAAPPA